MEEKDYVNDDSFKNGFNPFGSKVVGIFLLVFIILGGAGCLFSFYIKPNYIDKENEVYTPKTDTTPVENTVKGLMLNDRNRDLTNEYTNTLVLRLFYNEEDKSYSACKSEDNTCPGIIVRTVNIKVKGDVDYYNAYLNKYIVYRDDSKIKIYDVYSNDSFITNINANYNDYKIIADNDNILGLTYMDNDRYYYYSFLTNKNVFNDGYTKIEMLSNKFIVGYMEDCITDVQNGNTNTTCSQKYIDIYNTSDNRKAKTIIIPVTIEEINNRELLVKYYSVSDTDGYIMIAPKSNEKACKEIYTSNLTLITDCKDGEEEFLDENSINIDTDGLLHVTKGDIVTIYDTTGKIITTRNK